MNKNEFLAALAATKNENWSVNRIGFVRCQHVGDWRCPLTQLAGVEGTIDTKKAAEILGIDRYLRFEIIGAADWPSKDLKLASTTELRREMLEALGLQERENYEY